MEDISDVMTDAFFKDPETKRGDILIFRQDDVDVPYKIVKLNKSKKICVVKKTKLYSEQGLKRKLKQDDVERRLIK